MRAVSKCMYLLLTTCLLVACGGAPTEEAECGLLVEQNGFEDSMSGIVACQHAAVKHDLTTCALMRGWRLAFRETDHWIDESGRSVAGLTYCDRGTIQVGNGVRYPTYAGAFIHELRHLQDCPFPDHENFPYQEIEQARYEAADEDGRPVRP